jgi:hypothetical protein
MTEKLAELFEENAEEQRPARPTKRRLH